MRALGTLTLSLPTELTVCSKALWQSSDPAEQGVAEPSWVCFLRPLKMGRAVEKVGFASSELHVSRAPGLLSASSQ